MANDDENDNAGAVPGSPATLPQVLLRLIAQKRTEGKFAAMPDDGGVFEGDVDSIVTIRLACRILVLVEFVTSERYPTVSGLPSRHTDDELCPCAPSSAAHDADRRARTSTISRNCLAAAALLYAAKLRGLWVIPAKFLATYARQIGGGEVRPAKSSRPDKDNPAADWVRGEFFAYEMIIAQLVVRLPVDIIRGPETFIYPAADAALTLWLRDGVGVDLSNAILRRTDSFPCGADAMHDAVQLGLLLLQQRADGCAEGPDARDVWAALCPRGAALAAAFAALAVLSAPRRRHGETGSEQSDARHRTTRRHEISRCVWSATHRSESTADTGKVDEADVEKSVGASLWPGDRQMSAADVLIAAAQWLCLRHMELSPAVRPTVAVSGAFTLAVMEEIGTRSETAAHAMRRRPTLATG
jgi:hypothetical protein